MTNPALRMIFLLCLIMSCLPVSAQAADKVVVIPLFGHGKPLKNIVTVAKANGMFTDPVAAVNSITDASADNPYLVVIGPGVYTLTHTLVMKPWVDITGSGENVTRLVGAISGGDSASSSMVQTASHAVLSNMSIKNTGGDDYSIGVRIAGGFGQVRRITTEAIDGGNNRGIEIYHTSARLIDVTVLAGFGHENIAIANYQAPSLEMNHVLARATGGSSSFNYGVLNSYSNSRMVGVTAEAYGGMTNAAVYNNASSPLMIRVQTNAWDGANSYGVYNFAPSSVVVNSPVIRRSTIKGATHGVYSINCSGLTFLSQSTISGGVSVSWPATAKCVACDGDYDAIGTDCH